MGLPDIDLDSLSVEERLRLLEQVWESLSRTGGEGRLTPEQQGELDRRLDELESEEEPEGIPWDEVLRQIRSAR